MLILFSKFSTWVILRGEMKLIEKNLSFPVGELQSLISGILNSREQRCNFKFWCPGRCKAGKGSKYLSPCVGAATVVAAGWVALPQCKLPKHGPLAAAARMLWSCQSGSLSRLTPGALIPIPQPQVMLPMGRSVQHRLPQRFSSDPPKQTGEYASEPCSEYRQAGGGSGLWILIFFPPSFAMFCNLEQKPNACNATYNSAFIHPII